MEVFSKETRMNMKGFTILVLLIAILGGCGSKESASIEKPSTAPPQLSEEFPVEVVEVVPKVISFNLSAVGSLKTPEHVTISPKRAGIISKIFVREGDQVKKGQLLVQLDDVDSRLQFERAEAGVRAAEASLETDLNSLGRFQKLLESKVIPQQTYDDIRLKVKLDEARLAVSKAELNLASQNLLDHKIVSPIEGIVNLKIASLGEHVNVAPKDEILTLVQMDPLELEFYLPENWAGKIRIGDRVHFTVKTFSEETFSAILRFISPTADPSTRNVRMKASVPNIHHRLKPGFFAEVMIQADTHSNALVIPESALFNQEGKPFAFVVQNKTAHRREVETGQRLKGEVEILKGIQRGDQVVTTGHEQLGEGMRVRIISK